MCVGDMLVYVKYIYICIYMYKLYTHKNVRVHETPGKIQNTTLVLSAHV